jgi:hypothetical protein
METLDQDLSIRIMEAVKDLLPKGVGFIMICGEARSGADLSITSNLPDATALLYLETTIESIKNDPPIILDSNGTLDSKLN